MPSHSVAERRELASALTTAGPQAPTLCTGWTTRDLAAHLVTRERRLDAAPGMILSDRSLPGRWTARVQATYAQLDFEELVQMFRTGPPLLSWARLPGVDARVNLLEHLIHCEDVRRAQDDWEPRSMPGARERAVWSALGSAAKMLLRRSPVPVTFATPDGASMPVVSGTGSANAPGTLPGVVVTGAPVELALFSFGRGAQAQIELDGPTESVSLFRALKL